MNSFAKQFRNDVIDEMEGVVPARRTRGDTMPKGAGEGAIEERLPKSPKKPREQKPKTT